ncbi:multidrug transporter AcrB, partial [Stenotrophomonas sp. KAs 5-3]
TIPLVLAMTFFVMHYFDIGLHKISLGALVLALGLLVDDAIIAVEMMATKMEQGYDRLRAASFAWESTAFPMLTGTLITAAGFLPIATAASSTGEYTRSLFQVVTIALVVSWIAAVLFIPYLGDKMLPDLFNPQPPKPGSVSARWHAKRQQWADRYPALANLIAPPQHGHDHDPYQRPFYRSFRRFLDGCLRHRWWVIAATIALFVFSLMMFRFVPQQFFPDSTRPELMVDIELAEGASLRSTQAQAEKLEKLLSSREGIANYVSYVGTGSPRFYLPLDQQLPATNFAQFVVLAKDIKARESTRDWLLHEVIPKFPDVQMRVTRLENGPPVGYPVQMRISGEHIEKVQAIARQVEAKVRENPHVMNVNLDWSEPSKVVRLVIDQERARALGVSSAQVSQFLSSSLAGQSVSVYREGNRQIEMLLRGPADERNQLELLSSLSMPTANGGSITLSQVATMEYGFEDGIIWHRNRLPTVTVRADISDGMQPLDVVHQILPTLDGIRAELPNGYLLETGGTVEDSARGQNSIKAGMPLFLVVVATLLMLQLRSFSRAAMVLVTAPLGIIGATLFLLLFRAPFGFVALLGTIALAGMIMRNSVILIDQIQQDIDAGHDRWHSIIDATVRRFRPIVLTALAAVLAMIPLSRSAFYGSMAISIMGGLIVGTVLTLVFLPALYAAWFRVKPDESGA